LDYGTDSLLQRRRSGLPETCRAQVVKVVRAAEAALQPVTARVGTAKAPELLHDAREPYIKHDELVAVQFQHAETAKPVGVIVQWNCHPETLGGKNTEISADFVGAVVETVAASIVVRSSISPGRSAAWMTSLKVPVQDEQGQELADGTIAKPSAMVNR